MNLSYTKVTSLASMESLQNSTSISKIRILLIHFKVSFYNNLYGSLSSVKNLLFKNYSIQILVVVGDHVVWFIENPKS